jgi:hypothetical protein
MATKAFKDNYALIDWSKEIEVVRKEALPPKRSSLPAPRIMSDTMEPVQSMLDGKMYTSKSALRATYRAGGVVEVGNDPARFKKPQKQKPDRVKIKQTLEKAEARFNRGERVRYDRVASE